MTAGDARLDAIQARLDAADATGVEWSSLPAMTDDNVIMFRVYDDEGHAIAECGDMAVANLAANAPADVAFLLAELRKAHEALTRVERLALKWEADFPSKAADLRAAVAAANGDGEDA